MNKKAQKIVFKKAGLLALIIVVFGNYLQAQTAMSNVESRHLSSLNGEWQVILDPTRIGEWKQVWLEKKPKSKTDFIEYSFDGGPMLKVPGDFNSQLPELTYLEGIVWYKKVFHYKSNNEKRLFVHFGSVNYLAEVYLNGEKIGSHEGGFTPFQFEITNKVKEGQNTLIVKADSQCLYNSLPGTGYDWFNYGGITREVNLIETDKTFIDDYSVQLKKGSLNKVLGWVQLNGNNAKQKIKLKIPELNKIYKTESDSKGHASIAFDLNLKLWSHENPKLYKIIIESETDTVVDTIGFRCIEVQGSKVLLNKKEIFFKGVNIHEENPNKGGRAYSKEDALLLLNSAKELGCNLVRLAHYPHNENMIKEAEKLGLMVWSELPIYQHIQFSDSLVPKKMETMLKEMIHRDKNRCGVVIWSLSNETYPDTANRTDALIELTQKCRAIDSTRLINHVINTQSYTNNAFNVSDPLYEYPDLICINEYIGWYIPWQGKPSNVKWSFAYPDKPVFISEFGAEAVYGNNDGPKDEASGWTEEYQKQVYIDQLEMFKTIPNLCGISPWLLFDYKSLGRMNQVHQKGYNRKGLLSEKGEKKKAWYIMNDYYRKK
jgi:beta-glucuronidase